MSQKCNTFPLTFENNVYILHRGGAENMRMQKEDSLESEYFQITVKVWQKTYKKLKGMKQTQETSIVKLIDRGVNLLEKDGHPEQ